MLSYFVNRFRKNCRVNENNAGKDINILDYDVPPSHQLSPLVTSHLYNEYCSSTSYKSPTIKKCLLFSTNEESNQPPTDQTTQEPLYETTEEYDNKIHNFYSHSKILNIKAIIFTIKALTICSFEYMKYRFNILSFNDMVKSIAVKLANQNMFYIKLFQAFATNNTVLDDELGEFFTRYTDNVPYTDDEYDVEDLKRLEGIDLDEQTVQYYLRRVTSYSCVANSDDNNKNINLTSNSNNNNNNSSSDSLEMVNPEYENHHEEVKERCQLRILHNYTPIKSGMMSIIFEGEIAGHRVIVKYLRKNIHERFNEAIDVILNFAKFANKLPRLRYMNIEEIIFENAISIHEQIDFHNEVSNIKMFYSKWENNNYVKIPYVFNEYTNINKNIIVMERIYGMKLGEIQVDDRDGFAIALSKFNMKCVLYDRVYHGDLHPGNMLFMHHGDQYIIGVIDFGIIGKMNKSEQNDIYNVMKLIFKKKFTSSATLIVNDFSERSTTISPKYNKTTEQIICEVRDVMMKSETEIRWVGVADLYNINRVLNENGRKFKNVLYKVLLALAVGDSIGHKLGTKRSYFDHFIRSFGEMFNITFDESEREVVIEGSDANIHSELDDHDDDNESKLSESMSMSLLQDFMD